MLGLPGKGGDRVPVARARRAGPCPGRTSEGPRRWRPPRPFWKTRTAAFSTRPAGASSDPRGP